MKLTPKNWNEFQHYSDRKPTWIKLHRALLDDYAFACLPVASRALAPCLWLLASEYQNGEIIASEAEIAFRLRMSERDVKIALKPLIEAGFFFASDTLAECKPTAIPEKEEQVEIQVEKDIDQWPSDYETVFWKLYPRRVGKLGALKALRRVRDQRLVSWRALIESVRRYAASADPKFTKHPQTWINNGCWDDDYGPPEATAILPITEEEKQKLFAELRQ